MYFITAQRAVTHKQNPDGRGGFRDLIQICTNKCSTKPALPHQ
ncbi:hypothetical protein MC7420_1886 [Coleofasciculus chthonoplastes PCC 7420]|uniref:Uncharacterized protein n=1 Tax=Coleofasciculus chthonoplastes PCC 7420 TaxID=118168 RepID=B4VM57_9CYAN|nr:hypothetical protein MC7420_1886 [Coleofasciculus chthonoplastes PCC 7420]